MKYISLAIFLLTVLMVFASFGWISSTAMATPTPYGIFGNWEFIPDVSDEFDSFDSSKWETDNTSWSDKWTWDPANVTVSNGIMKVAMEYNVHSNIDNVPNGWNESSSRWGYPWSYVIDDAPNSGLKHLRHNSQDCYGLQDVSTYQDINNIPNGTYTFKAYVRSSGGQNQAYIKLKNHGGTDIVRNITSSANYSLYQIDNINVTTGKINITIFSEFDPGEWIDVDDVSLIKDGESTERVVNGNFEDTDTVYYKSGSVVSKNKVGTNAYYEARIKGASRYPGVCPAFWLTHYSPKEHREIDLVELQQHGLQTLWYVLHNGYSETLSRPGDGWWNVWHDAYLAPFDPRNDYHIYGCEVTDTDIIFYLDGIERARVDASSLTYGSKEYNIWLSMGLRNPLKGTPSSSGFPTHMSVDYVRVWKRAAPTHSGQLLHDDFEDGDDAGWSKNGGSWSIVQSGGTNVYKQSDNFGYASSHRGSTSWDNYWVQVEMTPISFGSGGVMSLDFRYTDQNNRYWTYLGDGNIYLKKKVAGTTTTLASKAYTVNTGTKYILRAEADGSLIKIYVNGVQELSATDSSLSTGAVGLATWLGTVEFDNVDVREIEKKVDDSDASIVYIGSWNHPNDIPACYNNTISSNATNNDYATFTFNGTSISLYGRKSSWCGKMAIYIDDIYMQTIDTYSSSTQD